AGPPPGRRGYLLRLGTGFPPVYNYVTNQPGVRYVVLPRLLSAIGYRFGLPCLLYAGARR
ncbi:MAG: hypothetical protein WBW01_02735, partial [Terriglobales bacterium]